MDVLKLSVKVSAFAPVTMASADKDRRPSLSARFFIVRYVWGGCGDWLLGFQKSELRLRLSTFETGLLSGTACGQRNAVRKNRPVMIFGHETTLLKNLCRRP